MRQVEEGTEWLVEPVKGLHLGINRITHQLAVGLDIGPVKAKLELTPSALEQAGLAMIRLAGQTSPP